MMEVACEGLGTCNYDQRSFKAYLSQWLAGTTQLVPETYDAISKLLQTSALAAAQQCSGGSDGKTCGLRWTQGATWDGQYGPGEQMSAMSVFGEFCCSFLLLQELLLIQSFLAANLIQQVKPPVTNATGGNSTGNNAAGSTGDDNTLVNGPKITTADKAGAGILAVLFGSGIIGGAVWMAL